MKKFFTVCAALLLFVDLSGQNIYFNRSVEVSNDSSVRAVKDFWREYCVTIANGDLSRARQYWADGDGDLICHSLSPLVPIYAMCHHTMFEVRKVDSTTFQISTIMESDTVAPKDVLFVYTLYVRNIRGELKLVSGLAYGVEKKQITKRTYGVLDYYCDSRYRFNKRNAMAAKRFVDELCKKTHQEKPTLINYVLGRDLDEANLNLGFKFTILSSSNSSAGVSLYPNTILSCRENHFHELVHAVFRPNFPNASQLLHEGVATYFGGSGGKDFKQLVSILSEYVAKNPEIVFDNIESLNSTIGEDINPYYIIGALLVERAIKQDGYRGLLNLFSYSSASELFGHGFQVPDDQRDAYIRKLIQNHK